MATVPLVKNGRLVASLNVHLSAPHAWKPAELALIEETAERTWAAVELSRVRRRAVDLNEFLVRFSDQARDLLEPRAVAEAACRLPAEKLGVERACWMDVDWTTREWVIGAAFHVPDVPIVEGRFAFDEWQPFSSYHLAGRAVVVEDTQADARVSPEMRARYAAASIGAALATSILASGQLRCVLAINQRQPRRWTPEEVALVQGIAGRCWAEVERTRAAAALRERAAPPAHGPYDGAAHRPSHGKAGRALARTWHAERLIAPPGAPPETAGALARAAAAQGPQTSRR